MDILPTGEQENLLLGNDAQGTANIAAAHGVGPDQLGSTAGAAQIDFDFGLAVTEYMHMRWLVIVRENHHAQALGT